MLGLMARPARVGTATAASAAAVVAALELAGRALRIADLAHAGVALHSGRAVRAGRGIAARVGDRPALLRGARLGHAMAGIAAYVRHAAAAARQAHRAAAAVNRAAACVVDVAARAFELFTAKRNARTHRLRGRRVT